MKKTRSLKTKKRNKSQAPEIKDPLLKKALSDFPKLVKQKERAAREKEKILEAFAPMSRKLLKMMTKLK